MNKQSIVTVLLTFLISFPAICAQTPENKPVVTTPKKTKKKSAKKIKKTSEKKDQKKLIRDMNYAELKSAKERARTEKNNEMAVKYLEKMIPMCNNLEELSVIMLELADLLFDTGALEKAGKMYAEFSTLYPGSVKIEYASYKAVLCSFYAMLDAERDQTKTKQTIELAEQFLKRTELFKTHAPDVKTILGQCHQRLFDSEVSIFNFYVHRGMYRSAQKRLDHLRKDFLTCLPMAEPRILTLECDLAHKQNNMELFTKKQEELMKKFPAYHQELLVAQSNKKHFLQRF